MGRHRVALRLCRAAGTAAAVVAIVAASVVGLDGWADAAATQGARVGHASEAPPSGTPDRRS